MPRVPAACVSGIGGALADTAEKADTGATSASGAGTYGPFGAATGGMLGSRRTGGAHGTAGAPGGGTLVACASLRDSHAPVAHWLEHLDVACAFSDDVHSAADLYDPRLVVLPVFTEVQARRLAELVERRPGTSVLGVVMDVTGHDTHRAIQHGASWVLNTLLHPECCRNLLHMVIQAAGTGSGTVGLAAAGPDTVVLDMSGACTVGVGTAGSGRSGPAACETDPVDEGDSELLTLLCGPAPISEIAKRYYCSERSMYRRLRALYARYGVTGRHQLRREVARRRAGEQRSARK